MVNIAPSMLAADPLNIGRDIQKMVSAGAKIIHIDIMDAHLVPNLSYGPAMVKAIRKGFPSCILDVHLMMDNPAKYVNAFITSGADELTIHAEIEEDIPSIFKEIHSLGAKAGISIKPGTNVSEIEKYIEYVELILIMSVEPGFGGQKMMPDCLLKLSELRDMGYNGTLSVDGGINAENAKLAVQHGANRLVMGTALFNSQDPAKIIADLSAL
ncbi:MAG: ribulose-phosphate 3-epimerase [Christensenellaceae bacterium]|nr:ribulose-phosphate 3-epimerase [Christensenellaceae bacterium]